MDAVISGGVFASVALILGVFQHVLYLRQRVAAISRVEAKIDVLMKNAGLEFDPYEGIPEDIVNALRSEKKIMAIKLYKESTGVSLKEAKEYIEEIQRRCSLSQKS